MRIRDAQPTDWDAIWPFFRQIVAARETYAYDPDPSKLNPRRPVDGQRTGSDGRRPRP